MPEDQETVGEQTQPGNGNGSPAVETATITQAGSFDVLLDDDDLAEDLLDQDDGELTDDATDDAFPDDGELFEDVDDDDFDDFDFDVDDGGDVAAPAAAVVPGTMDDATAARLAKLEAAARELAAAEVERENRRVKRKVTAATTGAGATGFIPLLLQLLGVYDLDPALTATLSTVASLIGAFAAGWITPERTPPLPSSSAHSLLELGESS